MDDLRERLLRRDYLYADASAYRAGVEAALDALAALADAPPAQLRPQPPALFPTAGRAQSEASTTAVGNT